MCAHELQHPLAIDSVCKVSSLNVYEKIIGEAIPPKGTPSR